MNIKIIGKAATFFGIVSTVFVVLSAVTTYSLLQILSPTAPSNYVAIYILTTLMPYLFVAVISFVIAALLRGPGKERSEEEELPPAQPAENA